MKRFNSILFMAVLVVMTGLTWFVLFKNQTTKNLEYDKYVHMARRNMEKQIYVDAVANYKEALALTPKDYNLEMELAEAYYLWGNEEGFVTACNTAINIDATNSSAYLKLAKYYENLQKYHEALNVVKSADKVLERQEIEQLFYDLKNKIVMKSVGAKEITAWRKVGTVNYCTFQYENKWGMLNSDAKQSIRPQYEYIGVYDEVSKLIPVCFNEEYYYIDSDANRKLVGDYDYTFLGSFGDGYAPAQRDEKYGYININFEEKNFEYDFAGSFANGVAAVKQGEKWGLINKDFKMVTEMKYDDILIDDNGFCSMYGIIVAVDNGKYIFLNTEGKRTCEQQFDKAKIASSNSGAIAVQVEEKWGFADINGNMVIEAVYEDAYSFSLGLAAVKTISNWGYIDINKNLIISDDYMEARPFNSNGSAMVKTGDIWDMIVLCEYSD